MLRVPFSLKIEEAKLEKIRDIAYWDRTTVTDLLEEALDQLIKQREKENGEYQPRPKR